MSPTCRKAAPRSPRPRPSPQRAGKFAPGRTDFLNFGIGAAPTWLHFSVDNAVAVSALLRLSVETAWLDKVDIHFLENGKTVAEYFTGDLRPLFSRPVDSRYFVLDHGFVTASPKYSCACRRPTP